MKRKLMFVISVGMMVILSACGPKPTPTLSVADAQSTAIADAFAALTQTQAAMPTATETPIPSTPTATLPPPPTATMLLLPTLPPAPVATLPDTTATDPCNEPPPAEPKGKVVKVRFLNKTDSSLNLAFGMNQENEQKECGTYNFSINRYEEPETTVLAGCYWGWAWVLDPPSIAKNAEVLCLTDTNKSYSIWITSELVTFH